MASPVAARMEDSPRKRQKLSPPPPAPSAHVTEPPSENTTVAMEDYQDHSAANAQRDLGREESVGIRCFVNQTNKGFSGILKQRQVKNT
jgi:hypothetical protein